MKCREWGANAHTHNGGVQNNRAGFSPRTTTPTVLSRTLQGREEFDLERLPDLIDLEDRIQAPNQFVTKFQHWIEERCGRWWCWGWALWLFRQSSFRWRVPGGIQSCTTSGSAIVLVLRDIKREEYLGHKCLLKNGFKVTESSYDGC